MKTASREAVDVHRPAAIVPLGDPRRLQVAIEDEPQAGRHLGQRGIAGQAVRHRGRAGHRTDFRPLRSDTPESAEFCEDVLAEYAARGYRGDGKLLAFPSPPLLLVSS